MKASSSTNTDYILLVYWLILLIFGLLMLTSASAPVGYERFGDKYFFIKRQLLFGVLPGLVAFLISTKLPYRYIRLAAAPAFFGTVLLLLLVLIPGIGASFGTGAKSWLALGSYSFQPAEFAKLGLILFLAAFVSKLGRDIQELRGFALALGVAFLPLLFVILQPDVGTASILFAITFGMLVMSGARWLHLAGLALFGVGAFVLLIIVAPYRAARLTTFLHPELDPLGIGYHINQAFLAIGSGGWFGLGLGHSRQKFEYLPEVHADSIYAVMAEEMGFLFAAGVVVLLVLLAYRALDHAKKRNDLFSSLVIGGIIVWFLVQSFLNIGAMVGILPLTGVPLPFMSHGGTALMIGMAAMGLLINLARRRASSSTRTYGN